MNGTVEQRPLGIFIQLLPFFCRDAHGEIVGVVGRLGGHGEHFTRLGVHRHDRASFPNQSLFGDQLQVIIDGQADGLTRDRIGLLEPAYLAPDAVDDRAPHAVDTHEVIVVLPLEPGLAHNIAGAVAPAAFLDLIGADITAHVRHEPTGRIPAAIYHEHFQHRNIGAMRFDKIAVARGGLRLDHDRLEMRQRRGSLKLLLNVF